MTPEEVRKLTAEEIKIELDRLRARLFTLRSQAVTEKVEDLSQFGKVKRDIARLLTEQNARRPKPESASVKADRSAARRPVPNKIKPGSAKKPAARTRSKPAAKAATN